MTTRTAPADLDRPVPYALTPKAHAAIANPSRFPLIVCLCGSTRFVDEFNRQRRELTERGQIVLAIEIVTTQARQDDPQHADPALKARLDELHKRKIDLADYVLVLNVGGYIGDSTRSEIAYAHATGKPLRYLDPGTADGWACEVCGFGWFGTRPDDGRCPGCRSDD
jgi:rubrerythrin